MAKRRVSPVKTPTDIVSDFAERILADWRNTAQSIISLCCTAAEADKTLNKDQKKELLERLPFSSSVYSKFVQIGRDKRLRSKALLPLLPPSYSIIYPLTKLTNAQLDAAVEQKVIRPDQTRAGLAEWVVERGFGKQLETSGTRTPRCPKGFLAAIVLPENLTAEQLKELDDALRDLESKFRLTVVKPVRPHDALMSGWHNKVEAKLRTLAKKIVKDAKDKKIKNSKRSNETKSQCLMRIGWHPDETEIGSYMNVEEIKGVLDFIGRGDEFEALYRRAEGATKFPKQLEKLADEDAEHVTTTWTKPSIRPDDLMIANTYPSPRKKDPEPSLDELVEGFDDPNNSDSKT